MPDDVLTKLTTPEDCEQFASNVEKLGKPELALAARRRAIELRAAAHNASTAVKQEALEAVYAYERTLFAKHGKRLRASRTWQMIDRRGIIPAVEEVVTRNTESTGYAALVQMGMQDKSFEAVVLRHPEVFTANAVRRAQQRLDQS